MNLEVIYNSNNFCIPMDIILITNEYIYRQDQNIVFFCLKPLTQILVLHFSTVPSNVIFLLKIHFEPKCLFSERRSINFQYGCSKLRQFHYWHHLSKGRVYRRYNKCYKIIFEGSKCPLTFTKPLNLFIKYIIFFIS